MRSVPLIVVVFAVLFAFASTGCGKLEQPPPRADTDANEESHDDTDGTPSGAVPASRLTRTDSTDEDEATDDDGPPIPRDLDDRQLIVLAELLDRMPVEPVERDRVRPARTDRERPARTDRERPARTDRERPARTDRERSDDDE